MRALKPFVALCSVVGLLVVGPVISHAGAATTTVACGQTVTRSTTLASDVGPCPGDGIVVAANGVTLNLNGHRVFGTADPEATGDFAGIRLQGTTGATVNGGGTVDHFAAGVVVQRGAANTVDNVTVHDNVSACEREVHNQSPGLLGDGIVLFSSSRNRVRNNRSSNNGPFSGISIVSETNRSSGKLTGPVPTDNTVTGNTVSNNQTCFGDMGIRIEGPGARNNVVSSNSVSGSLNEGIAVLAVIARDVTGFGTTCSDPVTDPTLPLCPLFVPPNPPNTDNQITGNHSFENGQGPPVSGISLIAFPDTNNPQRNIIRGNRTERNGGSGISVIGGDLLPDFPIFYGATNNTIVNNTSVNNDASGVPGRFDLIDDNTDRPCDSNRWLGNIYGTAFPACTTIGGRQVRSSAGPPLPASGTARSGTAVSAPRPRFVPRFVG
jgi:hypothetical protein